jgi:hypothetical protein
MHWPPPVIKGALAIGECAAPTIKRSVVGQKVRNVVRANSPPYSWVKSRKLHLCSVELMVITNDSMSLKRPSDCVHDFYAQNLCIHSQCSHVLLAHLNIPKCIHFTPSHPRDAWWSMLSIMMRVAKKWCDLTLYTWSCLDLILLMHRCIEGLSGRSIRHSDLVYWRQAWLTLHTVRLR